MTATGPFQVAPALASDDLARLRTSIATNGIMVPIKIDENGVIIDGHHRQMIANQLGIDCPQEVLAGLTDPEKIEMARTLNRDRRHLDREQKREMIAASLRRDPQLADRQHAANIGASPTTVGSVRRELQDEGAVSKLDTRIDSTGRTQPASKPAQQRRTPLPDAAEKAGWEFRRTVERIERLAADDRFPANQERVAAMLQGHIQYALDVLPGLRDRLLGLEPAAIDEEPTR
jgi:ParB-like chromosome segregation protein Spo0J